MCSKSVIEKPNAFFSLEIADGPVNKFRNPIWGDDEEDDDDELYHNGVEDGSSDMNDHRDVNVHVYTSETPKEGSRNSSRDQFFNGFEPGDVDEQVEKHVEDAFRTMESFFGNMHTMFGDVGSIIEDMDKLFGDFNRGESHMLEVPPPDDSNIRDHYLKPGYRHGNNEKNDNDLDGKVAPDDIASLLKRKDQISELVPKIPFESDQHINSGSTTSYFKSIVTRTYTKPDGTIETHKIVRDQDGNIEETITTSDPSGSGNNNILFIHPDDGMRIDDPTNGAFNSFKSFFKIF